MKNIKEKFGKRLILEQDGATAHTCKNIRHLQKKSPTKNGWSKNPPNSPDLAYPMEDFWVLLSLN